MLAHHLVSLFGLTYGLYTGMYGCELVTVIAGSESSNPFLQTRWFLKEYDLYKGNLAKFIDYSFVATFLFVRLGVGSLYHIRVQTDPATDLIPIIGGNAFYIISIIFGVQILRFFTKKYIWKKSSEAKRSSD